MVITMVPSHSALLRIKCIHLKDLAQSLSVKARFIIFIIHNTPPPATITAVSMGSSRKERAIAVDLRDLNFTVDRGHEG